VTITWEGVAGQEFEVSLKDSIEDTFTVVDTMVAPETSTSWTDDGLWAGGSHPSTVEERYYKVTRYAQDSENSVGMFRISAQEGMNLVGSPLVPMGSSPEELVGGQLTGANNEGDADRLWVWNGTNYEFAWLVEGTGPPFDGTWYTGSTPTTITLEADQGFWIQIRSAHGATDVFLLGEIADGDRVIPLDVGMNLVSPSCPVGRALGDQGTADSNLWENGATGADNEGDADRVWSWTGTNYQLHWLVDDVDLAHNGLWYTGNNQSPMEIEPGKGYWVQVREGHDAFTWTYPVIP
jgi:hypothetical protein